MLTKKFYMIINYCLMFPSTLERRKTLQWYLLQVNHRTVVPCALIG